MYKQSFNYANFEYKAMKTVGLTGFTNQTPPMHFGWKICLSFIPVKMRKYLSNVQKIGDAHFYCVNKHYVKIEY